MTVPVIISSMGDWNVYAIGFESRTFVNKHELFMAIFKTHETDKQRGRLHSAQSPHDQPVRTSDTVWGPLDKPYFLPLVTYFSQCMPESCGRDIQTKSFIQGNARVEVLDAKRDGKVAKI